MPYIAIGCLGFAILHLFDLFSIKKTPAAKPVSWVAGSVLLIYALIRITSDSAKISLPAWTIWMGWVLFAISTLFLLYALFGNLPWRKTYLALGVNDKLVTTGLYALVRHPGVHWFTLALLSLILISRSWLLVEAAPIFIFLDIVLVIFQDKFFFVRMFSEYPTYQRETPMLIPNRKSIDAFIKSVKRQTRSMSVEERGSNA